MTKMYIGKYEITNSVNSNQQVHWEFLRTEADVEAWKYRQDAAIHRWNYETPGAQSMRYGSFTQYEAEHFINMEVSELTDLTFGQFIRLMDIVRLAMNNQGANSAMATSI